MAIDWGGSGWLRQRAAEKAQAEEAARQRQFEKDQSWTRLGQGVLGSLADVAIQTGGQALGEYAKQQMPDAQLQRRYTQELIEQGERQQGRADVRMAAEREKTSADRAAQQMKELEDRQRWGMDSPGAPAVPGAAGPSAQGVRPSPGASDLGPEWSGFSGRRGKEGPTGMGRMGGEGVQGTPAIPPSPLPTVGGSQASPEQMTRAAAKVKAEREAARAALIQKAQFAAAKMPLGTETVKRGRNSQTLRTQRITDAPRDPTDVTTYRVDEPMKVPAMSGGGGGKAKVKSRFFDENFKRIDPEVVYGAATPNQLAALQAFNEGKGDPAAIEAGRKIYQGMLRDGTIKGAQLKSSTTDANIGSREGMQEKRLEARINAINETYDRKAAAAKTKAEYDAIEAERAQAFKLQGIQFTGQVREHGAGQTIRGITGEREGPTAGTPMPQAPAPATLGTPLDETLPLVRKARAAGMPASVRTVEAAQKWAEENNL